MEDERTIGRSSAELRPDRLAWAIAAFGLCFMVGLGLVITVFAFVAM